MTDLFTYLLQASFVFTVFFVIYKIVLSRLTFHTVNRYVLVALIPISLTLPLSDHLIPSPLKTSLEIPFSTHISFDSIIKISKASNIEQNPTFDYWEMATIIYLFISFLFMFRSLRTVGKLLVLKYRSKASKKQGYQIIETKKAEVFSFFNWIFVPKRNLTELNPIVLEHEKTHVQLKHSLDILAAEFYAAFFWFNPIVYAFKRSLKAVHEFQVDHRLTQNTVSPSEYLQLLLQYTTGEKQEVLYHYFNYSILKKRVDMMVKTKTSNYKKLAYLIILPFSLILCMSFIKENYEAPKEYFIQQETSFLFPVHNGSQKDITSHFGVKRRFLKKKEKRVHQGIDIRANESTSVLAAEEGIVVKASNEGNWGNLIIVRHMNGYETWYAHLRDFAVSKNQKVKKGEHIGSIGKTGKSFGFHLHFELKHEGININPINHIKE